MMKLAFPYGVSDDVVEYGLPPSKPPKEKNQHDSEKTEKNYGADISTLIELLDRGEL